MKNSNSSSTSSNNNKVNISYKVKNPYKAFNPKKNNPLDKIIA
jgi:hypothetical protein